MSAALHDTVSTRLAAAGNRYTASRRALVDLLSSAGRPLAVEEILSSAHELPRGSVYRNLGVLAESGVVHAIAGHDDFTRYELDEGLMGHHHHMACTACGSLTDVKFSPDLEVRLNTEIERAVKKANFSPEAHRLDILGVCQACRSR